MRKCETCEFYFALDDIEGRCFRYPSHENSYVDGWCGEWRAKDALADELDAAAARHDELAQIAEVLDTVADVFLGNEKTLSEKVYRLIKCYLKEKRKRAEYGQRNMAISAERDELKKRVAEHGAPRSIKLFVDNVEICETPRNAWQQFKFYGAFINQGIHTLRFEVAPDQTETKAPPEPTPVITGPGNYITNNNHMVSISRKLPNLDVWVGDYGNDYKIDYWLSCGAQIDGNIDTTITGQWRNATGMDKESAPAPDSRAALVAECRELFSKTPKANWIVHCGPCDRSMYFKSEPTITNTGHWHSVDDECCNFDNNLKWSGDWRESKVSRKECEA